MSPWNTLWADALGQVFQRFHPKTSQWVWVLTQQRPFVDVNDPNYLKTSTDTQSWPSPIPCWSFHVFWKGAKTMDRRNIKEEWKAFSVVYTVSKWSWGFSPWNNGKRSLGKRRHLKYCRNLTAAQGWWKSSGESPCDITKGGFSVGFGTQSKGELFFFAHYGDL